MKNIVISLVCALGLGILASSSNGQLLWNDGTGNWFTPGNWTPPGPPAITDDAEINNGGTAQINAAGATAQRLTLGNADMESGNLTVGAGGALTVDLNLTVGEHGTGSVAVSGGGTILTGDFSVGNNSGSTGTATIDGAGSKIEIGPFASAATVGDFGTGSLTISNTATFKAAALAIGDNGGNGTVLIQSGGTANTVSFGAFLGNSDTAVGLATVTGAGSKWTSGHIDVGVGGMGTLHIAAGGEIDSTTVSIGTSTGGIGVATVDGANSKWVINGGTGNADLTVGGAGNGSLSITNGGVVTSSGGNIAGSAGGVGSVTVDGTNSQWTNTGTLNIGEAGDGTLDVKNAGMVSAGLIFIADQAGSTGVANVDGTGSVLKTTSAGIGIGFSGNGTLNVTNGGLVDNAGNGQIGSQAGAVGTVNVDGTGSKWTNGGNLGIASNGDGMMNITNGGEVTNVEGYLGSGGFGTPVSGTATVDGAGSMWTNSSFLIIGENASATGTLHVQNGGVVSNTNGTLGQNTDSVGNATVDGAGSTWTNTGTFYVGFDGDGSLSITNGGAVSVGGAFARIAGHSSSTSSVLVDGAGSTWTLAHELDVARDGIGTMTIQNGGTVNMTGADRAAIAVSAGSSGTATVTGAGSTWNIAGSLLVAPGGSGLLNVINGGVVSAAGGVQIFSAGTLAGDGTVVANVNNAGLVSPGNPQTGTLTITGNYSQDSAGTMRTEFGGLGMGQHDLLLVSNTATLDGTLELAPVNGYKPAVGDSFTILLAPGGRTGTFATVDSEFAGLIQPTVDYEPTFVDVNFALADTFGHQALTPNQKAVAHELDEIAGDPRADNLINFLGNEPVAVLPFEFDLIAPEELASLYEISFSQNLVQNQNIQHRLDDIRAGAAGFCSNFQQHVSGKESSDGKGVLSPTGQVINTAVDPRWGFFVSGYGDFVNVDNDFNATGYDITTGNVTVGADYRVSRHFAIGVDGGYSGSTANLFGDGEVSVDSGRVGAYATVFGFNFWGSDIHVDAGVNGAWNTYDTRRTGLQGLQVRGDTDGSELSAFISYGGDWHFGCLLLGTWSTIQYTNVDLDGFTETGSLAPLHINDQSEDSFIGTTGARVAYDWHCGSVIVRPEARAAWMHESSDQAYAVSARFANGAGDTFTVHGPKAGRDAALVDAGVSFIFGSHYSAFLFYDGVLGRDNYNSNNVSGGFRLSF